MEAFIIIDAISDLHGFYPDLQGGDLLIVAGDLTASDTPMEHREFFEWLCSQHYKKKIFIAGNHDKYWSSHSLEWHEPYPEYLCDSGTEFEGLKIWGSPWTLTFDGMNPNCMAFTCENEAEIETKWRKIPKGVDILITHSPPYSILDQVSYIDFGQEEAEHVGSHSLLYYSRMQQPRLHVFGHIHEGYGKNFYINDPYKPNDIYYVNASIMNEVYAPVNKPIRIEL